MRILTLRNLSFEIDGCEYHCEGPIKVKEAIGFSKESKGPSNTAQDNYTFGDLKDEIDQARRALRSNKVSFQVWQVVNSLLGLYRAASMDKGKWWPASKFKVKLRSIPGYSVEYILNVYAAAGIVDVRPSNRNHVVRGVEKPIMDYRVNRKRVGDLGITKLIRRFSYKDNRMTVRRIIGVEEDE